ncbi:MAG TPA: GAF domain-containing protein [Candidatus Dormibacteraeota bacterium]
MATMGHITGTGAAESRLARLRGVDDERAYLYQIVETISCGPDLEAILRGTVRLVCEAVACHGCFIYFVQEGRLVLRAAPPRYRHREGKVSLAMGEGLTGWAAKTRRSAFIRENALDDPRVVHVPELEEELFQSLVSVPILSRAGDVIGVITLHAQAPYEFSRKDRDFIESTATLVAGAVENARLYEEATARVGLLTELSTLSQRIGSAQSVAELLTVVVRGCRELVGAERCEIHLLDAERLVLRAASPQRYARPVVDTRGLWLDVLRGGRTLGPEETSALPVILWGPQASGTPLFVPLSVGDSRVGLLCVLARHLSDDARSVLTSIASHTAVAVRQHQFIESLKEKNLVKEFFEILSRDHVHGEELAAQAERLRCNLDTPHVVLHALPWETALPARRRGGRRAEGAPAETRDWGELAGRVETALATELPGAIFDRWETSLRGLLRVPPGGGEAIVELVRRVYGEGRTAAAGLVSVGLSNACRGRDSYPHGFEEAAAAATVGPLIAGSPRVFTYEELGPYRYVLGSDPGVRDQYQDRLERLVEYDRRRGTELLDTLERYLDKRGNIVGTARVLYLHSNTLRQRLTRIERLAELDLAGEDWLSLAIAIRVVKLRMLRQSAHDDRRADDG